MFWKLSNVWAGFHHPRVQRFKRNGLTIVTLLLEMREKMSKTRTQKEQVLAHLQKRKSITSWDAIQKYGITRLAHYIYVLKDSYNIQTINEKSDESRYARYVYLGER
jgi:ACT domain-containing protein